MIKAAGNWFDLALALGVSYDILRNIRDTHRDNQTCLLEMLTARLKTATLTYSEIYQSLRTVGQNDVAEAIEEEYLGMSIVDHTISISIMISQQYFSK